MTNHPTVRQPKLGELNQYHRQHAIRKFNHVLKKKTTQMIKRTVDTL